MDNEEMIPAGPVRNSVVGLIGLIDHARKYLWSQDPAVSEFISRVSEVATELVNQLPENAPPE